MSHEATLADPHFSEATFNHIKYTIDPAFRDGAFAGYLHTLEKEAALYSPHEWAIALKPFFDYTEILLNAYDGIPPVLHSGEDICTFEEDSEKLQDITDEMLKEAYTPVIASGQLCMMAQRICLLHEEEAVSYFLPVSIKNEFADLMYRIAEREHNPSVNSVETEKYLSNYASYHVPPAMRSAKYCLFTLMKHEMSHDENPDKWKPIDAAITQELTQEKRTKDEVTETDIAERVFAHYPKPDLTAKLLQP